MNTSTNLYGAWLDPHGELIPVEEERHYEKAIEILGLSFTETNLSWKDLYEMMFQARYIRLIFRQNGEYYLEFSPVQSITWQQKSYIKNAAKIGYI